MLLGLLIGDEAALIGTSMNRAVSSPSRDSGVADRNCGQHLAVFQRFEAKRFASGVVVRGLSMVRFLKNGCVGQPVKARSILTL